GAGAAACRSRGTARDHRLRAAACGARARRVVRLELSNRDARCRGLRARELRMRLGADRPPRPRRRRPAALTLGSTHRSRDNLLDFPAAGRSTLRPVSNPKALFTIGELARRTGLSVRTIRFWSDEGVVPATARSATGYRMYDVEAVARVDLVRTLRELGLDLDQVREVLQRQTTLADVAAAHARALDAEIRVLKVRRAVLLSVARRRSSTEEMKIMHKMAKLSAAERQRLIDEFVDEVFAGCRPDHPGASIAQGMRMLPAELPNDPTPEQ